MSTDRPATTDQKPKAYGAEPAEPEPFEGHQPRECGEHRTTGSRAWCFDCHEWCYPHSPCVRCELPVLRAELTEAHRCPSCDHLTEGHTAAGCWYVIDDHSPIADGICPCTRVHKPAATPEQDGEQAEDPR